MASKKKLTLQLSKICEIIYFCHFAEYIPEDVLLDIKDKLDDTLSYIYKKYNVEQHTKVACETLKKRWRDICGKTSFYLPSMRIRCM